jgi:hypothetical protein
MPVPWLAVLQSVPWSDVIKNAPKVADGARKLWSSVGGKPQAGGVPEAAAPAAAPDARAIATLEPRLGGVERAITDLHAQMLASSELIKALADQNAQLIQRIETNRVRWLWLAAAVVLVGVVAVAALALAWLGKPHV